MEAGPAKKFFTVFYGGHGVKSGQDDGDSLLLSPTQDLWTWANVSGQDETEGRSFQCSRLDIGTIPTGDDRLVGLPSQVCKGTLCTHGAHDQIFYEALNGPVGAQDFSPDTLTQPCMSPSPSNPRNPD